MKQDQILVTKSRVLHLYLRDRSQLGPEHFGYLPLSRTQREIKDNIKEYDIVYDLKQQLFSKEQTKGKEKKKKQQSPRQ